MAPGEYESYLKALGYLQRYDKPGNPDLATNFQAEFVTSDVNGTQCHVIVPTEDRVWP